MTIAVVELSALLAAAEFGHLNATCRCVALSPDGPGPEAGWKELTAASTCGEICRAGVDEVGICGGSPAGRFAKSWL